MLLPKAKQLRGESSKTELCVPTLSLMPCVHAGWLGSPEANQGVFGSSELVPKLISHLCLEG